MSDEEKVQLLLLRSKAFAYVKQRIHNQDAGDLMNTWYSYNRKKIEKISDRLHYNAQIGFNYIISGTENNNNFSIEIWGPILGG